MLERAITKVSEYSRIYQLDFAYIIKNEFWVYLREGIVLMATISTSVAFARLAPKEVLGQYNFIFAIWGIIALLSLPGLDDAVLRSVARGSDGIFKAATKTKLLWSFLGTPVLLGIGGYYYYYSTQIIGICLMISSVFFPLIWGPSLWGRFLEGKKRFDLMARYGSVRPVINAIAIIAILFSNPNHLILIVTVSLAVQASVVCFFYFRSQKYIENNIEDNECRKYGYFLTTTRIVGTIAQNIDKIIIGTFLGPVQLAIYAIALAIPTKIRAFLKLGWVPFMPKFSQDGIQMTQVREKLKKLILPLTLVVLGGSLLYWFFLDDFMLLLFSSKYLESIIYSKLLLVSILVIIPNAFFRHFTTAKKKRKAIVLGLHVSPFLRLGIVASFTYLWGIMGAVWAINLDTIMQTFLYWIGMRNERSIPAEGAE